MLIPLAKTKQVNAINVASSLPVKQDQSKSRVEIEPAVLVQWPWNTVLRQQLNQTYRLLSHKQEEKNSLTTPAEVRLLGTRQKQYFLSAIGGLPAERCNLLPRVTGIIDRLEYTVEKVIFQSQPEFYVTANLYLPKNRQGKVPAVIVACGHAYLAKAYYQSLGRLLAKNGIASLIVDPVGQGERMQLIDRKTGSQICRWGVMEHSYIGLMCTLAGENIARYFVWDLIRAFDYLETRPEIDRARIGAAGTSGGGTQTSQFILLDDRIAAAAPSCYITERLIYMKRFHAHDAEQNYFGHIPAGFNYDGFFATFAPKPLLLVGVTKDFFPIEGFQQTYQTVLNYYKAFAAQKQCRYVVDDSEHMLTPNNRRAMLVFFAETLAGKTVKDLNFDEDDALTPGELQCTGSGQVLVEYPNAVSLPDLIIARLPTPMRLPRSQRIARVRSLIKKETSNCPLEPKVLFSAENDNQWLVEKVQFTSEPGIMIEGLFIKPKKCSDKVPVTVVVGTDLFTKFESIELMIRLRDLWIGGSGIFLLNTRGQGAMECSLSSGATYSPLFILAYNAWMLGENLVCQRAYDVVRGVKYLRSRPDVDLEHISLHAEGEMAMAGLLAAVAEGNLHRCVFKNLPASYAGALRNIYYDRTVINEWTSIFGMLKDFDIPELLECIQTSDMNKND